MKPGERTRGPAADLIQRAAEWMAGSRFAVSLTGAGLGTESGIPDFRSPGGIWSRLDRNDFTYRRYVNDAEARVRYWRLSLPLYARTREAVPHAGHRALTELRARGILRRIITQNTDGLHQKAGFPEGDLIELHGTSHWVRCLACGRREDRESVNRRVEGGELPPHCPACGGVQKTDAVFFGEGIPPARMEAANEWAARADVFLVVGTSLAIQPAAGLPARARAGGGKVIIVNREATRLDAAADILLRGNAGEILPRLARETASRSARSAGAR
ncbi:MAG: NAD-dependent deacetylase [Nitrospinota bacterium]